MSDHQENIKAETMFESGIDETVLYGQTEEALKKNKFIVFKVGPENYAVDARCVKQIESTFTINHLPFVPQHIKGVVQFRGMIVSVTDLSILYGVSSTDDSQFIVVVDDANLKTGLLVQGPVSFIELDPDLLKDYVPPGDESNKSEVRHQVEWKDQLIAILDVKSLLQKTRVHE